MKIRTLEKRLAHGTAATVMAAATLVTPAHAEPGPVELVDALNGLFGRHAGARASHAKGFCAEGVFTPAPEARGLTSAPLLATPSVPARLRFSIGGGNPKAPDKSRSVRGMAVRLGSGGEAYDLVLISEPVFFASTPESFVSFLQARMPDPDTHKPDPHKIEAHNARFPEGKLQPGLLAAHPAPYSYATTPYYSNHAFRFIASGGKASYARIVATPVAGTRYLSEDEEKHLPDVFLEPEFIQRLGHGPVEFELQAQLAGPGDSLHNPAAPWSSGQRVPLGRLAVQRVSGQGCDADVFVPTRLPAGIEPSDDPVLHARAAAYQVSFARRTQ